MSLLIAEELLLVTALPDGSGPASGTEVDCALGGALLVELVLEGVAELDGKLIRLRAPSSPTTPAATTPSPTTAPPGAEPAGMRPTLAIARDIVGAKPRRPKTLVARLRKGARRRVLAGLVSAGVLADEPYRWLGFIPRRRYLLRDTGARDEVLGRLRAAVLDGRQPSPRTAALASMVGAAKLEKRVFPDADRREVRRRIREVSDGDWAAKAVRNAIDAIRAATVGAAVAASTAATSGG